MFFHFHVPPNPGHPQGPGQDSIELNVNGEPKYLQSPQGLIINDPTLIRFKPDIPEPVQEPAKEIVEDSNNP